MWVVFFIFICSIVFAETERIIVKPKDINYMSVLNSKYIIKKHMDKLGVVVIEVEREKYAETIHELRKDIYIEYAIKDYKIRVQTVCPSPQNQWWNALINVDSAKNFCLSFSPITVAVIDTGVAYDHPDFNGRLWNNTNEVCGNGEDDDGNGFVDDCLGYDFVNNDHDPYDDNGHGTHIAGIIGALDDNNDNVNGINPGARIMSIKVLNSQGVGYVSDLIQGIYYAVDNGAKVINLSLGALLEFTCEDIDELLAPLREAFIYAENKGVLIVSAAGNESLNLDNKLYIPAAIKTNNHIVVGAVKKNGSRADYSNYGRRTVHVGAPGGIPSNDSSSTEICSLLPGEEYGYMSGTSIATPFVSGVASLIYSCNGGMNFRKVKARILMSAWKVRSASLSGIFMTEGIINANYALSVIDAPAIFNIEPDKASPGSFIKINGANFGTSGNVYLGNIQLNNIKKWTDILIEVQIPPDITVNPNNPFSEVVVEGGNYINSNAYRIELVEGNVPPKVKLCADKLSGSAPLEVTIKALAEDPDGQIVDYVWDIPNSVVYKKDTETQKVIVFHEPGTYPIEIMVKDNKGETATDKIGITVTYGSGLYSKGQNPCFIATAVYGEGSPFLDILRKFRDKVLSRYVIGEKFIDLYYTISPPIAEYLKHKPFLSLIVAIILFPVVVGAWFIVNIGYLFIYILLFLLILFYYLNNVKK